MAQLNPANQSWASNCLNVLSIALLISYCSTENTNEPIKFDARKCSLVVPNLPKLNFTEIFKPQGTNFTIPNILDHKSDTNRTLRFDLCRGLRKSSIKCEGRDSSGFSACLYEPKTLDLLKLDNRSSSIVGNISKAHFYYDTTSKQQPKVYWLTKAKADNCNNDKPEDSPRIKVVFNCLKDGQTMNKLPTFMGHTNCTYNFEWAVSDKLCDWLKPAEETKEMTRPVIPSPITEKPQQNNTAQVQDNHNEVKSTNTTNTVPTSKDAHNSTSIDTKSITNDKKESKKPTPIKKAKVRSSTTLKPLVKESASSSTTPTTAANIKPKMNTWHKIFMTGLIIVSLVGFIVGLLILDKKTQLRIPLGSLAGRGRFNRRTVPYNRMGDGLDI